MTRPRLRSGRLVLLLVLLIPALAGLRPLSPVTQAQTTAPWWNEAWPYRIPVTAAGSGVAEVVVDFSAAFDALGLNAALLDIRSLRVVPYRNGSPGAPLPHAETYSTLLDDAENPQIGWSDNGVYWTVNDGAGEADRGRAAQGSGSLKATVENLPGGYGYPGVELRIAGDDPRRDWRPYESFVYDVWPEVNASALDQAPDLYSFKLYNTNGCDSNNITQGGPPLALDQWNYASVSLKPLHTCTTPELNDISRMEFHTRDNETVNGNSGLWDDGDRLTLWFDNLRLVDQDGGGTVRWQADGSGSYYIYFDVLEHAGHPLPEPANLGRAGISATPGAPEAGGYFHQVSGASSGDLRVWAAPPIEKILRSHVPPVATSPLRIQAARNEFEPFQIVVRAANARSLPVSISDFRSDAASIPVTNVRLHRVDYVTLTRLSDAFGRPGEWPDPLYPLAMGANVDFPANANQPLWFTVKVPPDAVPGIYSATVGIGTAVIPIELEVWDFALPQTISLASEWGFGWSSIVETYRGTVGGRVQDCYWNLVDALYEDFAAHRLTPKGVGWPAGLNYPGGVEYDCNGNLDADAWGDWDFQTLAQQYLQGQALDNGSGFPSFLLRGPASNWPPASRPGSFCEQSRGDEPPGNSAYNDKWFQYWAAVSDYLGANADYAERGYYHIVNEPQTFADYDIVASLAQRTKAAAPNVRILISEQVEPAIYNNATYPGAKIDIWMPTISNYQVARAQDRQRNHGEEVWWYFLYGDRPPLPNPTVIDRPGIEARITPWLAWLERVDGLLYYSSTAWNPDPWQSPWTDNGNGDGVLFYPPRDGTIAFDACSLQSNRLVPSIRWELLREGMEDYEYLRLLHGGDPQIGSSNQADLLAQAFINSRTSFSRVPTDLYAARAALAGELDAGRPRAGKTVSRNLVNTNEAFTYQLEYRAGAEAHTVSISDSVPAGLTIIGAGGNKAPEPEIADRLVTWSVPVAAKETVTLTIEVIGSTAGSFRNTAGFAGSEELSAGVDVVIGDIRQVYLPHIRH